MTHLALLLALAGSAVQGPTPTKTAAPGAATQRPEPNPTVQDAHAVLDRLIKERQPRLPADDTKLWLQQVTWLTSIRDRLQNLMTLVAAPAKVTTPQPIASSHLKALQEEVERESQKFNMLSNVLKTRHDIAMNAIRNMK